MAAAEAPKRHGTDGSRKVDGEGSTGARTAAGPILGQIRPNERCLNSCSTGKSDQEFKYFQKRNF